MNALVHSCTDARRYIDIHTHTRTRRQARLHARTNARVYNEQVRCVAVLWSERGGRGGGGGGMSTSWDMSIGWDMSTGYLPHLQTNFFVSDLSSRK